ncbi:DNA-processing protein DprA [Clostridium beijerinckii]|uniref:DNA-processing protein DprA n=1 Tax=Clostridium beijerinckii TaxID=1520 RepID=UPI002226F0E1|nr:DNA-processing protein DprA [Clostridium beijerinckii]UYZ36812.1 DNA-processing protein DprA [Clostridium beijerinckii]
MDKLYYLVLYLLGLKSNELVFIMEHIPKSDIKKILLAEGLEIQYKYSIDLSKYAQKLTDKKFIEELFKKAEEIINKSKELDIKIIPITSKYYPNILKEIKDPPAILYIKGKNITLRDEKSVGCVGARMATEFGVNATKGIVQALSNEKFTIVSGLATGIDGESHKACLRQNGRTIAVLAHGLDMIYPKENTELSDEIINKGGTLVSEYPVGTSPDKFRFVQRNRIIAGLSRGVIIFESKEKSGSMHTVNFSLENNRKVFCPLPSKRVVNVMGLINLIESKKAIPLGCKNDYKIVVKELGYKLNPKLEQSNSIKNDSLKHINKFYVQDPNLISNIKNMNYNNYSSIKTNKDIFIQFKKILKENDLSVKEFFNGVILSIVRNYTRGDKK